MAKYINKNNYLIIKLLPTKATKLNFGVKTDSEYNMIICDNCNNICTGDEIYYVPILNRILCEECLDDIAKNMEKVDDFDSIDYEIKHFNYYAKELNLKERAMMTPNGKLEVYINGSSSNISNTYT